MPTPKSLSPIYFYFFIFLRLALGEGKRQAKGADDDEEGVRREKKCNDKLVREWV
jgi:hypothetical protein